jgi:hypothetical protein
VSDLPHLAAQVYYDQVFRISLTSRIRARPERFNLADDADFVGRSGGFFPKLFGAVSDLVGRHEQNLNMNGRVVITQANTLHGQPVREYPLPNIYKPLC